MIDIPLLARPKPARLLAALRQRLRTSELWLIALSVGVGAAAGLLAVFQSQIAHALQSLLYGIGPYDRLSARAYIPWTEAIWLPMGGLALGAFTWLVRRRRTTPLVDVVEANALYGGVLRVVDSAIVCVQTVLSNGVGASVGLEAAYAQAGGAAASWTGGRLRLRRHDMRILVGAGAGAAIGAAFGAPLTGAFYAFEIVIGSYTPSAIAPVAAACLASVLAAKAVGGVPYSIEIKTQSSPDAIAYLLYAGLGLICALVGVAIMRLVPAMERAVRAAKIPTVLRPAVGGVLLGGLAVLTPQTMSSGHGALHLDLAVGVPLAILGLVFVLKTMASVISLGFGFRGGLFFASLFLGTLLGQMYAGATDFIDVGARLSAENAALVGMGALAVAVVGGPLTMSFLVLETTRDIGWMRSLTAGRMMRRDPQTIAATATVAEFRRRFPLGAGSRAILLDSKDRYAGLVRTATAYAEDVDLEGPIESLAITREAVLTPDMNIETVMRAFEASEADELAVVDDDRQVLGLLAEAYVTRRYASELERQHLDLYGEARS